MALAISGSYCDVLSPVEGFTYLLRYSGKAAPKGNDRLETHATHVTLVRSPFFNLSPSAETHTMQWLIESTRFILNQTLTPKDGTRTHTAGLPPTLYQPSAYLNAMR